MVGAHRSVHHRKHRLSQAPGPACRRQAAHCRGRSPRRARRLFADSEYRHHTEAIARALLRHRGLRVITNNLHVADILSDNPDCEVIVAGGVVRSRDRGIVGEATMDFIRQFKVDIGLIGISGIEADGTCATTTSAKCGWPAPSSNSPRSLARRDSSKFKRQAMVELAHISQIDRFFTDAHPQEPLAQVLLDAGVRCDVAAAPNTLKQTP
ncbi:DeoR/GlpR family DNA-binding transcription regulator [Achromobacter insolitus]|uniref:DeoR/GlpR family DNA-binding transcription regulator n=1 Tax=Achromobacter insolitus TaxID=217204 RepID=UPI001FC9DE8B|nr:hypothetical protein [Achromobacter insolitus]